MCSLVTHQCLNDRGRQPHPDNVQDKRVGCSCSISASVLSAEERTGARGVPSGHPTHTLFMITPLISSADMSAFLQSLPSQTIALIFSSPGWELWSQGKWLYKNYTEMGKYIYHIYRTKHVHTFVYTQTIVTAFEKHSIYRAYFVIGT